MIKLENISKYYYSASSVVPALRKIKLDFKIGEFVAITGESGSGKTTLLNIISGLDTYDDGELFINGEGTSHFDDDDWEDYRKNKIGFVYQNHNLIENFTALYNVESSLLIQGFDSKEARRRAKELLRRVGLKNKINQRASKLSSGQKQRLSIARALAKNTDIIIADEPTANLDNESGKQVMKLLGELSKDKLIIVITHNYDETAPYVTRKVRLHDGEVVSDTLVNEAENKKEFNQSNHGSELTSGSKPDANDVKSDWRIAWRFARMNISTQPGRGILFVSFLLFMAVISFVFLGVIYSKMDDTFTRDYDDRAFLNSDNRRIVVKKPDGSAITKEDLKEFNKIKYVKMADQYDYANDINYYIDLGKDYDYSYQPNDDPTGKTRLKIVNFLETDKFIKSTTCITQEDLWVGRLPEAMNEVVLYAEDESRLGEEKNCYFTNKNSWSYDNYYTIPVKVVGLLKKESNQVYFSEELSHMLSLPMYDDHYMMHLSKELFTSQYNLQLSFIPVIGEGIKEKELRVSAALERTSEYDIPGEAQVYIYCGERDEGTYRDIVRINTIALDEYNEHSVKFVEISKEWFYELYQYKSNQASLYLEDYIYMDYVLNKLADRGYDGISSYRISSVKYNSWKVDQRNKDLGKAYLILGILILLEALIIGSFLKIRQKNYLILTALGMNYRMIKQMNYFEMLVYTGGTLLIVCTAANILKRLRIEYLTDIIKYYNIATYMIFIIFNVFAIMITVLFFNKYLKHKQKWI